MGSAGMLMFILRFKGIVGIGGSGGISRGIDRLGMGSAGMLMFILRFRGIVGSGGRVGMGGIERLGIGSAGMFKGGRLHLLMIDSPEL